MRAVYGCFRMGQCPHPMVTAVTAETLFRTGQCPHPMVMAVTAETLFRMDRCLHPMVMAVTAETCGSFRLPFKAQRHSGLQALSCEVGVWR